MEAGAEIESSPKRIPHWRLIFDQARVTPAVATYQYEGSGTIADPFIVTWIPDDPGNPMEFGAAKKWFLSLIGAISMLATAFCSSAFSGESMPQWLHGRLSDPQIQN
jgi:hypothetical protein